MGPRIVIPVKNTIILMFLSTKNLVKKSKEETKSLNKLEVVN